MLYRKRVLVALKPFPLIYRKISGLNLWEEEISNEIKHKIENHWKSKLPVKKFDENNNKDKFYVLSMFPYPSGNLHMGHVRVYTISDTIARFQRMNGKNVIHPIGWDAFGLPAENAAIDHEVDPQEWTKLNIGHMKSQLQALGCSFDWSREISTCDPKYYKWTQDLFLKLFHNDLIYRKNSLVNWDPVDCTVLADEQVDENGCSWRSGAKVEKKVLKQWFVRTTRFAKELRAGLDNSDLQDWRDIIKIQKHWIGECHGVNFDFKIPNSEDVITLWTPYPEYVRQIKFVAIKKEHSIFKGVQKSIDKPTIKLDIQLENPFTLEKIPIFVTEEIEYLDFTDSFVGIPSVCEMANKFAVENNVEFSEIKLSDEDVENERNQVCSQAKEMGIGGYWNSAKLKDWLISRQRYWGTPIPIINCENCGMQPVPKEDLPVTLPPLPSQIKRGQLHLEECKDWISTVCPKCNSKAKRETDTMDTFVDSSWYYLRYIDPNNENGMFDKEKANKIYPVDIYIGGKEHAVLHLYYARFISYFLHQCGLVPVKEPFKRLLVQGMVMGRSFKIKDSGKYVSPNDIKIINNKKNQAIVEKSGAPVVMAWEKMSKSKLNGVQPTDVFNEYGIDTTRLFILADVAPTSNRNWNSNTFPGVLNWQKRLWLTIRDFLRHRNNMPKIASEEEFQKHEDFMFDSRNFYITGTSFNYYISQQMSVAVSKQQGLTNSLRKMPPYVIANSLQFERALAVQIILLAPMAPHFASELWSGFLMAPNRLNKSDEILWDQSVLNQKWPETDFNYKLDLVCQVNSIDKCKIKVERSKLDQITLEEALSLAREQASLEDIFSNRNILQSTVKIHKGIKAVVNVKTKPCNSVRENKIEQEI